MILILAVLVDARSLYATIKVKSKRRGFFHDRQDQGREILHLRDLFLEFADALVKNMI